MAYRTVTNVCWVCRTGYKIKIKTDKFFSGQICQAIDPKDCFKCRCRVHLANNIINKTGKPDSESQKYIDKYPILRYIFKEYKI